MLLAANVSWHLPHMNSNSAVQMTDFASESVGSSGPAPSAPAAVVVAVPKTDKAISTTNIAAQPGDKVAKLVCGERYEVRFVEVVENSVTVTRAIVADLGASDAAEGTVVSKNIFSVLHKDTRSATVADSAIMSKINKMIDTELASRNKCSSTDVAEAPAPSPTAPSTTAPSPTAPPTRDVPDAEKIARGLRNCTLDKAGNPVKGDARFNCNLDRLSAISLDPDDQPDAQDDDDKGSRRSRRRTRTNNISQIENILEPMKDTIRAHLVSSNEDKRDQGSDELADTVDALMDIRSTASGQDRTQLDKIIQGLKYGYERGEKVNAATDKFLERTQQIDDKIADLKQQMSQVPMMQQYPIANAIANLQTAKLNIGQQMLVNPDYTTLTNYEQRGYIQASEYSDFTSEYNNLIAQIQGRQVNSNTAIASIQAPADASTVRNQVNSTIGAQYGIPSTVPQIDYTRLGAPTPQTSGSVVPTTLNSQFAGQPQLQPQYGQQPGFGQPQPQYGQPFVRN